MKHHKAFWLVDQPDYTSTDPDDKEPCIQENEIEAIVGTQLKKTDTNKNLWYGVMSNETEKIPAEMVFKIEEIVNKQWNI